MYQDLSTRHDWPVKKDNVDLPIKMNRNSRHFGYLINPLRTQNKDLGLNIMSARQATKYHEPKTCS